MNIIPKFSFLKMLNVRYLNAMSASITRTHRRLYQRTYPTVLVHPDGSTVNILYHEPRKIVKLPLDLATLSETERKARLERRRPKKKVKIEDDSIKDSFDRKKYIKYIKK